MSALSLNAVSSVAAQKERRLRQAGEHRRDPPSLQPAVDHETGEKEPDEQRRLQLDAALVGRGGAGKPEEEQEAADEERRIVRGEHRPRHEGHVRRGQPCRHGQELGRGPSPSSGTLHVGQRRPPGELAELAAEDQEVATGGDEDREHRPPAEVPEHERRVPVPRPRHHQHGRRGEMRQRAADRHVDEQQAERRVLQSRARLQVVELAREQQRADGHRRRLGDERSEHGPDDQDRDPPRGGRAAARRSPRPAGRLRRSR